MFEAVVTRRTDDQVKETLGTTPKITFMRPARMELGAHGRVAHFAVTREFDLINNE